MFRSKALHVFFGYDLVGSFVIDPASMSSKQGVNAIAFGGRNVLVLVASTAIQDVVSFRRIV